MFVVVLERIEAILEEVWFDLKFLDSSYIDVITAVWWSEYTFRAFIGTNKKEERKRKRKEKGKKKKWGNSISSKPIILLIICVFYS